MSVPWNGDRPPSSGLLLHAAPGPHLRHPMSRPAAIHTLPILIKKSLPSATRLAATHWHRGPGRDEEGTSRFADASKRNKQLQQVLRYQKPKNKLRVGLPRDTRPPPADAEDSRDLRSTTHNDMSVVSTTSMVGPSVCRLRQFQNKITYNPWAPGTSHMIHRLHAHDAPPGSASFSGCTWHFRRC